MNDQTDFRRLLRIARRRIGWLIFIPLACSIVAAALASAQPDVYQASADIRIDGDDIDTDVALITSQEVNAAARDRLGDATSDVLSVDAATIRGTQLARITVRASTPQTAALAANEWAGAFAAFRNDGQTADLLVERDGLLDAADLLVPELLDVEDRLSELEAIEEPTPDQRSEIADLRSRQSLLQSQQRDLVDRATGIQTQLITTPVIVTTTNQANEPRERSEPNPLRQALFGLFGGLFLALLAAGLAELLDDRIWEPSDLASATGGLPVLASIAPLGRADKTDQIPISMTRPQHPVTESFAMLGRTLRYEESLRAFPVIVTTSAIPDDGTSLVASNVAVAFAQLGESVLLVDFKFREQSRMRVFDLDRTEGIAEAIESGQPVMDFVRPIENTGPGSLSVLSAGSASVNPSSLAASSDMKQMVEHLRGQFDRVVIDAGALLVGTETVSIAEDADGVCLVARYRSTRGREIERALGRLDQVGVAELGVVICDAPDELFLVGTHARTTPFDGPKTESSNGQKADQHSTRAPWPA